MSQVELVPVPKLKSFAPKQFATRLPRDKMIPAEWTRGSAAAGQIEFCSKDPFFKNWIPVLRRLPFYHNSIFIGKCRELGLPIYLGREFGGLGYYHRIGRSDPPRMLSAVAHLTRHDESLEHFFQLKSLGGVWNIEATSPLGSIARNFCEYACKRSQAISISKVCDELDEKMPEYLKFNGEDGLWALVDKARKAGYVPIGEFYSSIEGFIYAAFPSRFKRVTYGKVPGIVDVSRRYNKILSSILAEIGDHKYNLQSVKKLNWWDIQSRLKWRAYTFFVPEEELNVARCHAFDKDIKVVGSGFFYLSSSAFDRFSTSAKVKLEYDPQLKDDIWADILLKSGTS